ARRRVVDRMDVAVEASLGLLARIARRKHGFDFGDSGAARERYQRNMARLLLVAFDHRVGVGGQLLDGDAQARLAERLAAEKSVDAARGDLAVLRTGY